MFCILKYVLMALIGVNTPYLIASLSGSVASTCCTVPFRCTVKHSIYMRTKYVYVWMVLRTCTAPSANNLHTVRCKLKFVVFCVNTKGMGVPGVLFRTVRKLFGLHVVCWCVPAFRATAFSTSLHWLWTGEVSNCLWYGSHGPVPSKVGILKVFGFPTSRLPVRYHLTSVDDCLWSSFHLDKLFLQLCQLLSHRADFLFLYFFNCCWTCCCTSFGITFRSCVICCRVSTPNAARSACCRSILVVNAVRYCSMLSCCWSALALTAVRCSRCWSILALTVASCPCCWSVLVLMAARCSCSWSALALIVARLTPASASFSESA